MVLTRFGARGGWFENKATISKFPLGIVIIIIIIFCSQLPLSNNPVPGYPYWVFFLFKSWEDVWGMYNFSVWSPQLAHLTRLLSAIKVKSTVLKHSILVQLTQLIPIQVPWILPNSSRSGLQRWWCKASAVNKAFDTRNFALPICLLWAPLCFALCTLSWPCTATLHIHVCNFYWRLRC